MTESSDVLLERRTIRKYFPDAIDNELLDSIIAQGCRASTTGNMQLYSIIITKSAEKKKELLPLHFNQKIVTEAPVLLTFCADFNRFSKWCRLRGAEPGYDNFLSFMTAAIDALLVAQTVCIAAEAEGLGICYLGTTTYMAKGIIDVLKLPAGVVPVTTIAMGWPAENPEQVDRLASAAIVHNEVYSDYRDADVDRYYSPKEARKDSIKFVAENDKQSLAQVFTDVRYKKADNVHFSNALLKVLSDQGFMNQ